MTEPAISECRADGRPVDHVKGWRQVHRCILTLVVGLLSAGATACSAQTPVPTSEIVLDGVEAVTVIHYEDDFVWADRVNGTVHGSAGELLAEVEVSVEGQRGLLGLAADDEGRLFAAYTDSNETLVVDQLLPVEGARRVWNGYQTASGANGGRLGLGTDGRLLLGVGTLRNSATIDDADAVNGKMLSLDPAGSPNQEPIVVSSGWFNPFAFVVLADGTVWVADNHPDDGVERLMMASAAAVADLPVELPAGSAPSGIAAVDDRLYICSITTGRLYRYRIESGMPSRAGTVVDDCHYDVAAMADGSLVYSTGTALRRIANPG